MFAIGEVAAILVITAMFAAGVMPEVLWRVALGLGAVPAIVLLLLRFNLPETAIWLIQKGRFREAKRVTNELYADNLDMLPDTDVEMRFHRWWRCHVIAELHLDSATSIQSCRSSSGSSCSRCFSNAIGPATATFVTAIFPLVGLLAAIIILPKVYGFVEVRLKQVAAQRPPVPVAPRAAAAD